MRDSPQKRNYRVLNHRERFSYAKKRRMKMRDPTEEAVATRCPIERPAEPGRNPAASTHL